MVVTVYIICSAAIVLAVGLGALCLWLLPVFMEAINGR